MGRQSEAIINHFSHPHPLHLTNPQPSQSCSACKQTLETEPFYTCRSPSCTTYSLHLKCSQLPPRITHPCHQQHHNHPLSLLPKSPNPNGVFTCKACGTHGDGFSYSCKDCDLNIHVVCATLPLFLSHRSHNHQLHLVFSPPYGSNAFSCDICGVIGGSKCWLYRCDFCGFDAHLSCATSKAQMFAGGGVSSRPENVILNQINIQRNQPLQPPMGYGGVGGNVNNQLLQMLMGGRGGGDINTQILKAMISGGGGGNHNQLLQMLGGGGGGGIGGGGGDLMQAFLNGSNGGFGGLDLSSVVGNIGDFGGLMGGFGF